MPPRTKRNANISRRHHSAAHSPLPLYDPPSPAQDLLSFDQDDPAQAAYGAMTRPPAVFDPDPPPSDPERGRPSAAILLTEPVDYAKDVFGPAQFESDIDDGGPASPSTSPPGPSSVGTGTFNFAFARADAPPSPPLPLPPAPGRSGISQLAAAEDTASDESSLGRSVGHIRAPVLAR